MHMGHYAGVNIHQHILAECGGGKPIFMTLQPFPNVIGLALGKKAATWTPDEGTRYGEDLMTSLFGDDMGNTCMFYPLLLHSRLRLTWTPACRDYMKFNEPCSA